LRPAPSASPGAPAPLYAVLAITFLGSVSGGAGWAGIFFVTAERYGFSPARNLALASSMGAVYAVTAWRAGALLRLLERHASARALLGATLALWGLVSLAPLAFPRLESALWLTGLLGTAGSAVTWPIVESYLAAGRHGARMRSAIGWFNVTWTPAVATSLLLKPLIARWDALGTIAISALMNAIALGFVAALPRQPGAHEREAAQAAVGREYAQLARASSWLLPLSYLMSATLSPVLPHRLAAVGASAGAASIIAASWMGTRFLTLLIMWRTGFWHGRWGTLAAGACALGAGLGVVLLAPSLGAVIAGLTLFGAGMGLTYYAALYYSLAVGHAAVDAGGSFEALIGLGYCVGPLLGLAGHELAGGSGAASATVALTGVAATLAGGAALPHYLRARRGRGP